MRKILIGFIIFLVALAFLTIGIIEVQYSLISSLYEEMILIP
ncbi:MAG: hypothetical protein ACFE8E_09590 [Candidatus Hodarchaeota archaeon]